MNQKHILCMDRKAGHFTFRIRNKKKGGYNKENRKKQKVKEVTDNEKDNWNLFADGTMLVSLPWLANLRSHRAG